jgi:hypothetical protein
MNFVLPFLLLLPSAAKQNAISLTTVSAVVAVGLWLQQYLLAMPSLASGDNSFGWQEALVTGGFAAGFVLASRIWRFR